MLLVGFNDRQRVFITRNSWGGAWGVDGYAYLPYDYVTSPELNFLGMYAITGLTDFDFTADDDDGADFPISRAEGIPDTEPPVVDTVEDAAEAVEEDGFDAEDMFDATAEARRAFRMFQAEGTGKLDRDGLFQAARANGYFLTPAQLDDALVRFGREEDGKDGAGGLSFESFCQLQGIFETGDPALQERQRRQQQGRQSSAGTGNQRSHTRTRNSNSSAGRSQPKMQRVANWISAQASDMPGRRNVTNWISGMWYGKRKDEL